MIFWLLNIFLVSRSQCFCSPHPFYHLLGENKSALQSKSTLLLKQHDLKDSFMLYTRAVTISYVPKFNTTYITLDTTVCVHILAMEG